jgi:hypothetical protein
MVQDLKHQRTESSYQISHLNELMHFVKIYVYDHTKLLLRQIRYKECCFHVKLQRHHRRRHRSFTSSNTVDVANVSLSSCQLDYLSRSGQLYFL